MKTCINPATQPSLDDLLGYSVLDTLDEYRKDCRRGICHHRQCHRRVERLCAEAVKPVSDEEVGFDIMATWEDYRKDCFLGLCNHVDCRREFARRARMDRHEEVSEVGGYGRPRVLVCTAGRS